MIRSESPPAEIHRKARELLAAEYRTIGDITCANAISTDPDICGREKLAIRAIEAALSLTPPAAAVPDGWRFKRESDGLILVSPPTSGTYGVIAQGKDKLLYALADALLSAAPQPQSEATQQPEAARQSLEFTLTEAKNLLALFGGSDASITVELHLHDRKFDDGDLAPAGLYAHCTDYPEEGSTYLGPVEVRDDEPEAAQAVSADPAIPAGFTPWGGGECPEEAKGTPTVVRLRDGTMCDRYSGDCYDWRHSGEGGDIIAYRVEQPATGKPDLQVAEAKAGADDRLAAEHAYTVGAFDYEHNPVGSLDWALFWKGWQAARAQPKPAEGGAVADRLAIKMLVAAGFVTEAKANEALRIAHGFERGELAPAGSGEAAEMSPEFTDTARGAIAWVLYHHQGGKSEIGQPLRYALGLGAHERMPEHLVAEAKRYAQIMGRTNEISVPVESLGRDAEGVEELLASENPKRKDFTVDEALKIADMHDNAHKYVPSVSRTLAAEVRRLTASDARPAYGIIDPDYARIFTIARCLAWAEGYALAMHGSFTRDLDLIAVPWADRVCEPEHLVNRIVDAAGLKPPRDSDPGQKPHGRLAWTLRLPGFGEPRWVDLSITPRVTLTAALNPEGDSNG